MGEILEFILTVFGEAILELLAWAWSHDRLSFGCLFWLFVVIAFLVAIGYIATTFF